MEKKKKYGSGKTVWQKRLMTSGKTFYSVEQFYGQFYEM